MRCAEMHEAMPAYVRDGEQSLAARRHLARCADCKAELARYELLLGTLGDLATTTVEPPANLALTLATIPAHGGPLDTVREHVARNRSVYLGGVAIAAAGAAGAALLRRRRVATA
jgi:hypothetical protein